MTGTIRPYRLPCLLFAASVLAAGPVAAQEADLALVEETALAAAPESEPRVIQPTVDTVTPDVISSLRDFIETEIVRQSIVNQNGKHAGLAEDEIIDLDQMWRAEHDADDQPLISATLTNPLSSYLTRIQAQAIGLYTEIFVMDAKGLNVGQSNISSDYWQGDEAKFQKTFPVGPTEVFVDEPEFNDRLGIWVAQVNMTIAESSKTRAIGAVTVEINLSELMRRQATDAI